MGRNKILLVFPLQGGAGAFLRHIPLGLLYTAAKLVKHGEPVEILDCRLDSAGWATTLESKIDSETLIVGISVMSGTPVVEASRISRIVKEKDPNIKVVWGGAHATFNPEAIVLNETNCDYVVSGYGNETFYSLVEAIKSDVSPENIKIPGTVINIGGEVVDNGKAPGFELIDYRDIPYHLLPDYSVYGHVGEKKRIFSMYSVMGCPYQCTFCSSPAQYRDLGKKKWVPLEVDATLNHIERVVNDYGAEFIYFIDDDSFVNLRHVEQLIDGMKERNIDVKLGFRGARVNEIKRMSDEFITKLAEAGTDVIHVGAESGSDRILKMIKKGCTAQDIIESNRKLAKHPEMKTIYNFMMGTPTETFEELQATRKLILTLVEDHENAIIVSPNRFRPLPNTELFDEAVKSGYVAPSTANEWSKYEVESMQRLPWVDDQSKKLMDLILIGSYFIDRKATKQAKGNSNIERFVRTIDAIYGPIGRWRMKSGNMQCFVEPALYRFTNSVIKKFSTDIATKRSMAGETLAVET